VTRFLAYWGLVFGLWGAVALGIVVAYFAWDLPDVSRLGAVTRQPVVALAAADGTTFATLGDLYGEPLTIADMAPALPAAVLATEDRRFYSHFGIDLIGLARAAWVNYRTGRFVQGGSTITQQLAKNVFLTPERTVTRKIQEAMLALWLEHRFTKDQIFTLYLNRVYMGGGAYGVDAAARRYFGKSARYLTISEAAMIAGLLKAPSRFSPLTDLDVARARANQVIANMEDAGYLTPQQAAAARAAPAGLPQRATTREARYFADWIMDQVADHVGSDAGDLKVVTTLDPGVQRAAEASIQTVLDRDGARLNAGQAALVALAPDGAVRAMVGGRSYADSQFNRATQARRQPGSAFKYFVYAAALEAGFTPDTVVDDGPIQIGSWRPGNFEPGYLGGVTLRTAFARSINTVAVKVLMRTGVRRTIELARRLGLTGDIPANASIALGTADVTPMELTAAYAAQVNDGTAVWPYGIVEIRDGNDRVLYRREGSGAGPALSPRTVSELSGMMQAVIREGTGKAARLDRPAGGKTGTTQDYRDAWFVGYTADLVAGVWVGNDDRAPMKRVTGGGLPAQIWKGFMEQALRGVPPHDLPADGGGGGGILDDLFARLAGTGSLDAPAAATATGASARPAAVPPPYQPVPDGSESAVLEGGPPRRSGR
jgi:penicillin-binding protein 1A